jgi:hypothetical protein
MVKLVFVLGLAMCTAAGCALFSEGPPENFCRADGDCFQAQGEVCNLDTKQCEPGDGIPPDAASDAPDAATD